MSCLKCRCVLATQLPLKRTPVGSEYIFTRNIERQRLSRALSKDVKKSQL